ncbi:MAG: ZIP family metal transporter, partial [Gemmatimonadota bacterium]
MLYAVVAAAGNVVGAAAITARPKWAPRTLELLLALSAGFLVAVSLTGLLPEALLAGGPTAPVIILLGFL